MATRIVVFSLGCLFVGAIGAAAVLAMAVAIGLKRKRVSPA
jgi:hypothetical protein